MGPVLRGRADFQLTDIVSEVRSLTKRSPEVTIRTQVSSVMCSNAPGHHTNHSNELTRVSHGWYRPASGMWTILEVAVFAA